LLPEFTATENVMMPQLIAGLNKAEARTRADQLLDMVGLSTRLHHRPSRLSGGEQQRVAVVRSIANVPRVVLADEPTGNLDPKTSMSVFDQLQEIMRASEIAMLIATHNIELANKMDRVVSMDKGKIVEI
jgi:lipoprotein-releasing system ATP-binding protein